MSTFTVHFDPQLPQAPHDDSDVALDAINWLRVLERMPDDFNLLYSVGGVLVAYYPAIILAVFTDLVDELALMRGRRPHVATISGYPVLDVEFEGEHVFFYHADERTKLKRAPICGPFSPKEVEASLSAALQDVWSVVRAAERGAEPI